MACFGGVVASMVVDASASRRRRLGGTIHPEWVFMLRALIHAAAFARVSWSPEHKAAPQAPKGSHLLQGAQGQPNRSHDPLATAIGGVHGPEEPVPL